MVLSQPSDVPNWTPTKLPYTLQSTAHVKQEIYIRNVETCGLSCIHAKRKMKFVSEVTLLVLKHKSSYIGRTYPEPTVPAEETGRSQDKPDTNDYQWIIDPLDGTTNYLHGFPHHSVSIALRYRQRLEAGVIFDPLRGELFCASRGNGATLNDRKIRVTNLVDLESALLGTGLPFREGQDIDSYLDTLRALMQRTSGIRRAGSAALDLAYVAAGRLDGFWEFDLNIWDIAAGCLIIQEAGGLVGDPAGGHTHWRLATSLQPIRNYSVDAGRSPPAS